MNSQALRYFAIVAVLVAVGVYQCMDWIRPPHIQIIPQLRPARTAAQAEDGVCSVAFILDKKYLLTRIKVVPVNALATNKNISPVWQLVASTNQEPQKGFVYGLPVKGMRPPPGTKTQPLMPGQDYRLFVEAGRITGQVDFRTQFDPGG